MNIKSLIFAGLCAMTATQLTGCAALGTEISHSSLDTQTLMSKSVFLTDTSTNKTVYVDIHNTTDKDIDIKSQLISNLQSKGYKIINSANRAHYVLQVNVLKLGETSKTAAKEMTDSGYGGTAEGIVAGAAIAGTNSRNMVAGGIIGAAVSTIADNAVKDVVMTGITDVKISEHLHSSRTKIYTTRIGMTAEQANLKFDTARAPIETGLAKSISGIF